MILYRQNAIKGCIRNKSHRFDLLISKVDIKKLKSHCMGKSVIN